MIVRVIAIAIEVSRRGTNGVGTDGVTAKFMLFDRGTFRVLPTTYFYIPKVPGCIFFPTICQIWFVRDQGLPALPGPSPSAAPTPEAPVWEESPMELGTPDPYPTKYK